MKQDVLIMVGEYGEESEDNNEAIRVGEWGLEKKPKQELVTSTRTTFSAEHRQQPTVSRTEIICAMLSATRSVRKYAFVRCTGGMPGSARSGGDMKVHRNRYSTPDMCGLSDA